MKKWLFTAALISVFFWQIALFKPFLTGGAIAAFLHEPVRFFRKKGCSPAAASFFSITLFMTGCTVFLMLVAAGGIRTLSHLRYVIPNYAPAAVAAFESIASRFIAFMPFDLALVFQQQLQALPALLQGGIEQAALQAMEWSTKGAAALPDLVVGGALALMTAFFLCTDYTYFLHLFPKKWQTKTAEAAQLFSHAMFAYGCAQLLLFCLSFGAAWIGLTLIGMPHVLELSFLTAAFDCIPLIGSIVLYGPAALFFLFTGQAQASASLLLVWLGATAARQLAEPRLLGRAGGIHPLFMLFAAFSGYTVSGAAGVIMAPILALAVSSCLRVFLTTR